MPMETTLIRPRISLPTKKQSFVVLDLEAMFLLPPHYHYQYQADYEHINHYTIYKLLMKKLRSHFFTYRLSLNTIFNFLTRRIIPTHSKTTPRSSARYGWSSCSVFVCNGDWERDYWMANPSCRKGGEQHIRISLLLNIRAGDGDVVGFVNEK